MNYPVGTHYAVDEIGIGGHRLLHEAACHHHPHTVGRLITAGADVNARDRHNHTPLHMAAAYGQLENMKLLVAAGAALDARAGSGPLYWHLDDLILCNTGRPFLSGSSRPGATALHIAVWHGHLDVVQWLLAQGAAVNAIDNAGRTPLYMAARYGYADICEKLVKCPNIEIDKPNTTTGHGPLMMAIHYAHTAVALVLVAAGADTTVLAIAQAELDDPGLPSPAVDRGAMAATLAAVREAIEAALVAELFADIKNAANDK